MIIEEEQKPTNEIHSWFTGSEQTAKQGSAQGEERGDEDGRAHLQAAAAPIPALPALS